MLDGFQKYLFSEFAYGEGTYLDKENLPPKMNFKYYILIKYTLSYECRMPNKTSMSRNLGTHSMSDTHRQTYDMSSIKLLNSRDIPV